MDETRWPLPTQSTPEPGPVPIRSFRERLVQTLAYELGGLLVVSPLWSALTRSSATKSIVLLAALSIAVTCWTAVYNTLFDLVDARLAGRLANDRRRRWRMVQWSGWSSLESW